MLQHATTLANIADAPPNLVNLLEFLPPSCSLLTSSNISLHLPALVATCCPFLWPLQLALHGAIQTTLSPRKGLTSVGILRLLDPRLDRFWAWLFWSTATSGQKDHQSRGSPCQKTRWPFTWSTLRSLRHCRASSSNRTTKELTCVRY